MNDSELKTRVPGVAQLEVRSPEAHGSVLGRLARAVIRNRRKVALVWLVMFIAGGFAASHISKRLSYDFSLPGQPAYVTGQRIMNVFGNGGTTIPSVIVVTVPKGQTVRLDAAKIAAAFDGARRANPRVRIADETLTRDPRFVTRDDKTTFAYVFAPPNQSLGADRITDAAVASVVRALPSY